ncbi:phospholipid transport system substrate-binding protein [Cognatiyoonia sediminum]|uniref:Phospholipid transport system substrate-binding protein n=1 Tax=Cognatiyoonia sediminum TaxID=1508389 RepID=A0A1M5PZC9_9RHOB|nr:ABC transporter substrate-binding protein [Cognatiyoonia sediminum]SHH06553.1 phospholipid transport system substrate-binding protein [Cognatiyoonia sediminum]
MFRRQFLVGTVALTLPTSSLAVSPAAAQSMVEDLVDDVNAVIASGASEQAMIDQFGQILNRYADVPTIARYCLGVDARRATASQMAQYTDAFQDYIASKYGRRFREFVGGEVRVVGSEAVKSWVEVETTVLLRGRSPLQMDWHVSNRSGRNAFFNFIIEGVNMLLTEREEIGAMLDRRRGSIDALISDMKAV